MLSINASNLQVKAIILILFSIYIAHKGKACSMLKDSSRRKRARHEMEEVKDEENLLKQDKFTYLQESKRLRIESQANNSVIASNNEESYIGLRNFND